MTKLSAIKARIEAATPGPWHTAAPAVEDFPEYDDSASVECTATGVCVVDCADDPDAAFIAHARTDLPWAVDWIERARGVFDAWLKNYEDLSIPCGDHSDEHGCDYCDEKMTAREVIQELLAELTDAGEG